MLPGEMSNRCSGGPAGLRRRTVPRDGPTTARQPRKAGPMFTTQDQDNRRAGARGLTRSHNGGMARRLRHATAGAVCTAAVALPLTAAASAQAATTTLPAYTTLKLVNGWTSYGSGLAKPAVANISGIVHLKGGMKTSGTNDVAFTLPVADRPAAEVYVPVDECGATNGRLDIAPSGIVSVEAEGNAWNEAQCFVSLDGVTFAKTASSFTALTPINGWAKYGQGTASPAARNISGIVYLRGAIHTSGTNQLAFILPPGDRPAYAVYVPVDQDDATNGRLVIHPDGTVYVDFESSWSEAQYFTSLDGVSFATSASSFTALTLQNGWTWGGYGTAGPAVRTISGVVYLEGSISSGTGVLAFTLPAGFRPAHDINVKVDLCGAHNGALYITPAGQVNVLAFGTNRTSAQCFTSLDGVSFAR